jgi:hypothetical protein
LGLVDYFTGVEIIADGLGAVLNESGDRANLYVHVDVDWSGISPSGIQELLQVFFSLIFVLVAELQFVFRNMGLTRLILLFNELFPRMRACHLMQAVLKTTFHLVDMHIRLTGLLTCLIIVHTLNHIL